jgi:LSD1 subclass zinc finger protein
MSALDFLFCTSCGQLLDTPTVESTHVQCSCCQQSHNCKGLLIALYYSTDLVDLEKYIVTTKSRPNAFSGALLAQQAAEGDIAEDEIFHGAVVCPMNASINSFHHFLD